MKPQDVFFVVIFGALILFRKFWLLPVGLICLVLAIPLFATWTFFTAERLTWYGSLFIALFIIEYLWTVRGGQHR